MPPFPAYHTQPPAPSTCCTAAVLALSLAACQAEPPQPAFHHVPQGDARRGQQLLSHYQCGSCHRIPEVPSSRNGHGPSLKHFGSRSYIAGQVPNLPPLLVHWLQDPQALVPGTAMPDMGVSEADARDMAAYLLELR